MQPKKRIRPFLHLLPGPVAQALLSKLPESMEEVIPIVTLLVSQVRFLMGCKYETSVYAVFRHQCYVGKSIAHRVRERLPGPCCRLFEHERLLIAHRRGRPFIPSRPLEHPYRYRS